MKKRALVRLESMFEHDKEEMNDASRQAAIADFMRVAGEYFEVNGIPQFTINAVKGGFEVSFGFRAHRIKNFTTLK